MPNDFFKFKQFTIRQNACSMKVGTDGVLLGAWVNAGENMQRILDIGTGTGVIAIMLAQRFLQAKIDAVEVDEAAANQALENVKSSPWNSRLNIFHQKFNEFANSANQRYDLIVSNPPYFLNSLTSPNSGRTTARHAEELQHEELIIGSLKLLSEQGKLAVIMPYVEGNIFIALAAKSGLFCNRKLNVSTKKDRPTKRLLMEFSRSKTKLDEENLYIENTTLNSFTDEYKELTKDFYLRF
ncbi:MAG: methyltransferase [Prevotellaceae bacterium]|jgi:tRNA1Val (adenine37-N6)-methyltransferase|nr:methyltransferase [Prevotellaceae bacterium]